MLDLPDPRSPPNKLDKLAMGPDCVRHPLIGNIVANNGTSAEEQTRNFLRSLLKAGQATEEEFKDLWRRLVAWEQAGNTVKLPARVAAADHPYATKEHSK